MKLYPWRVFSALLDKNAEAKARTEEISKNVEKLAQKMYHLINIIQDCPHCSKKLKGVRDKFKGKPLG